MNTQFLMFLVIALPLTCFLYLYLFRIAIISALREAQGEKFFNRLYIVAIVLPLLIIYVGLAQPFYRTYLFDFATIFMIAAIAYLMIEIPYQLVKSAASSVVEDVQAAGEDKRMVARIKSAQTLGNIIAKKLQISCELQAFSSNDEFVFLTYILNNKPLATRIKLNHADNAENWKKLGERIIENYQTESSPT